VGRRRVVAVVVAALVLVSGCTGSSGKSATSSSSGSPSPTVGGGGGPSGGSAAALAADYVCTIATADPQDRPGAATAFTGTLHLLADSTYALESQAPAAVTYDGATGILQFDGALRTVVLAYYATSTSSPRIVLHFPDGPVNTIQSVCYRHSSGPAPSSPVTGPLTPTTAAPADGFAGFAASGTTDGLSSGSTSRSAAFDLPVGHYRLTWNALDTRGAQGAVCADDFLVVPAGGTQYQAVDYSGATAPDQGSNQFAWSAGSQAQVLVTGVPGCRWSARVDPA
jgi:hypothetical protein